MYTPQHFVETDAQTLAAFIDAHAFGTLITTVDGRAFASHVPFLLDAQRRLLHCHVARANPQWRDLQTVTDALVVFTGPHGYVSPTWYAERGVPTWNYTSVHVYGDAICIDDAAHKARHVEALAAKHERDNEPAWVPDYDPLMLAGIVGIEIRIRELQGKFKLSQNRSVVDRARVAAAFEATGRDNGRALARLMKNV